MGVFRHELKFMISYPQKELLTRRLDGILQKDENCTDGMYFIRSLYFDDVFGSAYEEKMMGISERRKFRIRLYDYRDTFIKLEKKQKSGSYIHKVSASLNRSEVEDLLDGRYDFLLRRQEPVCREFYIECMSGGMRPAVIVDYDREPYVYAPGDVRITFDLHVRAAVAGYDIFDPSLPSLEALDADRLIMEVKYTDYLPQMIRNLLPPEYGEYTQASKYVLCMDRKNLLYG